VRTNKVVKAIPGVPGITGLEYVPELHKVYTSDLGRREDRSGGLTLDDGSQTSSDRGQTKRKCVRRTIPESLCRQTLGKAVAIVDVGKDEIIKTLKFNSETGMPGYDSVARRVYVNLRSTNEVAEIDPSTVLVVGRYPVEGCRYNHGMAVDSEHHRAFLLCGGSRTMAVFALDSHRVIVHLPLAPGADVVKFDPGLRRAYAACSSGVIGVYQEDDADHFRKLEDFTVQKLVHSLAVDTETDRLYAPEQEEDGNPVARMIVYEPNQKY